MKCSSLEKSPLAEMKISSPIFSMSSMLTHRKSAISARVYLLILPVRSK
jgi:hypothetical protein